MTVRTAFRVLAANLKRSWPLRLDIRGNWETFANADELDRYLSLRLEVPAHRIEDMAGMDAHGVQRELRHTRRSHQNAVDILVRAMETQTRLRYLWGLLDVGKVPEEHDWPSILFAVGAADNVSDAALRSVLTHYVHYLESRREILDSLGREWRQAARRGSGVRPVVPDAMRAGDANPAPSSRFTTRRNQLYARLPRRRAVNLDLKVRSEVPVYLARNRFLLKLVGDDVILSQQDGASWLLRPGRNMLGRSANCDVCLDSVNSDISRQHLLVEVIEGNQVRLTDLSSRGTYLSPDLLERMDSSTTSRHLH